MKILVEGEAVLECIDFGGGHRSCQKISVSVRAAWGHCYRNQEWVRHYF